MSDVALLHGGGGGGGEGGEGGGRGRETYCWGLWMTTLVLRPLYKKSSVQDSIGSVHVVGEG